MIGGAVQLSSNKNKGTDFFGNNTTTSNNLILSPQLGFGLNHNWVIGIAPALTHQVSKSKSKQQTVVYEQTAKTTIYTAAIFLRKFYSFNDKVGIYLQAQGSAGKGVDQSKTTQNGSIVSGPNKAKASVIAAELRPGLYFKATNKILIESSFGGLEYGHGSRKINGSSGKQIINTIGFTMGSSLTLGVNYIF